MQKKPSNTREQCAFDRGVQRARETKQRCLDIGARGMATADEMRAHREGRNPHKKGSAEYKFWNEGFDSV